MRSYSGLKRLGALLIMLPLCLGLHTCAFAEEPPPDYEALLIAAVTQGDEAAGEEAYQGYLAAQGIEEPPLTYAELVLLSKLIYTEAGSAWLTDELRLCVGEVALNRVASPEFPDTLEEVITQPGQYELYESGFREALPSKTCVRVALRLLQGERMLEPGVVYQSNYRLGEIYAIYYDTRLGFTYFCLSAYPELYVSG